MPKSNAVSPVNAPNLATAKAEEVPLLSESAFHEAFPNMKFVHDKYDGIHDRDFEYFGRMNKNVIFCDIGANIGQTVVTLRHLGSKASLHSFEINPTCWQLLEKRASSYQGNFALHRFGLADKDGAFDLYVPVNADAAVNTLGTLDLEALKTPHLTALLQRMIPGPDWRVIKMRVEVKTFDSLNIAPDFVKIDVEGFESHVLAGMTEIIKHKRPAFLIENTNPKSVEAVLVPLGYLPCGWDREKQMVHLGHGKYGNSLYLHATEIFALLTGKSKSQVPFDVVDGSFEKRHVGKLGEPTNEQYITEAFRVFFGIDPTAEQLVQHGKADKSRLAMRNRFIRFLLESPKD
jgi:FkbM family methyltransferase